MLGGTCSRENWTLGWKIVMMWCSSRPTQEHDAVIQCHANCAQFSLQMIFFFPRFSLSQPNQLVPYQVYQPARSLARRFYLSCPLSHIDDMLNLPPSRPQFPTPIAPSSMHLIYSHTYVARRPSSLSFPLLHSHLQNPTKRPRRVERL